jgi:hypothetical protein
MTVHKITTISISTESADPLRGVVEIEGEDAAMRFEINEDLAHGLCSDLERFLTQVPCRNHDELR